MKKFTSALIKLQPTTDPDICRLMCPVCGSNSVTFLTRQVVTLEGPVGHGTKGALKGNVISLLGVCHNAHHFILRMGNHTGVGLIWIDVPGEEEQAAHKEAMAKNVQLELPPDVPEVIDAAEDGCGSNTCPDCGNTIPQVNAPDLEGKGVCPSGVSISGAIGALKAGKSSPICEKCPILGCPGNPRNGTEAQHPDELVPGCPWSVEHYAVMAGWEKHKDLAICLKCPHVHCQVHPLFEEPSEVYADEHYSDDGPDGDVVDKNESAPDESKSVDIPVKTSPVDAAIQAIQNVYQGKQPLVTFETLPSARLTPDNLAFLRARLEATAADGAIGDAERKWATRLLNILKSPDAARSKELFASFQRMEKARKAAGLPEVLPSVLPIPTASPGPDPAPLIAEDLASSSLAQVVAKIHPAGKVMSVSDYITLLLNLIAREATPTEKAEAKGAAMPLASYLVRKMQTNAKAVSGIMQMLIHRLASAQALQLHSANGAVVTDIEQVLATLSGNNVPQSLLDAIKKKQVNIAPKKPGIDPKKKKDK